jgi:hypothetical protein
VTGPRRTTMTGAATTRKRRPAFCNLLTMEFKRRTLMQLADMICGNPPDKPTPFRYRSSSYMTEFFSDCDTDYVHDGTTRNQWVTDTLHKILAEPRLDGKTPPATFCRVIRVLMDQGDAMPGDAAGRPQALTLLNAALAREGFEAFYADDRQCYLPASRPTPSRRPPPIRTVRSQPQNYGSGSN